MRHPCDFRNNLRTLLILTAACAGSSAPGQSIGILRPDVFEAQAGKSVKLQFREDQAAAAVAWPTDGLDWLFVRSPGAQENMHKLKPAAAGESFVAVPVPNAGVAVIGSEHKSAMRTIARSEFEKLRGTYAPPEDKGASAASGATKAEGSGDVRVRAVDASKLIIRVTGETVEGAGPVAMSKTGQAAELRLLANPLAAKVGGEMPVVAYIDGIKQPGAKLTARCDSGGPAQERTCDSAGSAVFKLTQAGVWTFEFKLMRPSDDGGVSDWTLYRGAVSFSIAGDAK